MKKLIFPVAVFLIFAPSIALASGEAAEFRRMYKACVDSGGEAPSNYNDWVDNKGCRCGGSPFGSGNITCNKTSSSNNTSSSTEVPGIGSLIGALPLQQQIPAWGAAFGVMMILEGLTQSTQQGAQQDAQRRAAEEARVAEQKRIAEEREREAEAAKRRILSNLKGLDASPQLALMGNDSGDASPQLALIGIDSGSSLGLMTDDLQVRETIGFFGTKEIKPILEEDVHTGMQAGQGFDTAGKIMVSNLPPPPTTPTTKPTTKPVDNLQMDKVKADYYQAIDEYAKANLRRQQLEEEKKMAERIRQEAEKRYREQQAHIALIPQDQPAAKQEEDDKLAEAEKLLKQATDMDEKATQDLSKAKQNLEQVKLDLDRAEKAGADAVKSFTQTEPGQTK